MNTVGGNASAPFRAHPMSRCATGRFHPAEVCRLAAAVIPWNELSAALDNGTVMAAPAQSHYETLDGLRGVAALCVVAFHMAEMATPDLAHDPLRHAPMAVDFFFALSGFVMSHAYGRRLRATAGPAPRLTLKAFFIRRLIRLHPMVVAGMTLGLVSFLIDPFVGASSNLAANWPMLILVYGLSLLLLPEPNLPNRLGETHCLDAPAWSLFQEYIGNIAYGLFIHRLSKRQLAGLCMVSAIVLVAAFSRFPSIAQGWDLDHWWMGGVRLAYPFLAGILVQRLGWRIKLPGAYAWLSIILVLIFTAPLIGRFNSIAEALCVILVFPLMLCCGAGQTSVSGPIGAVCRFTGRLSYPLYMVHYPAIYIFSHWLWSHNPSAPAVWAAAITLYVGVVVLAALLMKFYDEPVRAYLTSKIARPAHGHGTPLAAGEAGARAEGVGG